MPSPFPGMDPYLEAHWLDIQPRLIVASANSLQRQLGDDLVARIEERVVLEDPTGYSRRIGPDVRVVEYGLPGEPVRAAEGVSVAEPLVFTVESEPVAQRFIEILDMATGGRVVTVIEILSPTNKLPGDGRDQYQSKQQECRDAKVNIAEIDLTRGGRRELLAHRWVRARQHDSTYQVSVWRAAWASRCELYPIGLRDRLPAIRVPLRPADADAVLDMQALIDQLYADARYDRTTDYGRPCDPPLEGDDAVWADELLRAAGRRE